jgi:hypothetical protein
MVMEQSTRRSSPGRKKQKELKRINRGNGTIDEEEFTR